MGAGSRGTPHLVDDGAGAEPHAARILARRISPGPVAGGRPVMQSPHRARRAQKGFTLIELMISITLVAAISAGMLMAMRAALLTLEKVDARLQSNRRVMG